MPISQNGQTHSNNSSNCQLSTNIQCEKNNHSLNFPKICKNIDRKTIFLAYFGHLKANYRLFLRLLILHCFFLTLITVFICIIPCAHIIFYYFLILCFYFHLLFLNLLTTKHILQFTMFHIISLQTARNITEIRNTSSLKTKQKALML